MLRRLLLGLLLLPGAATAQSLSGSYVYDGPAGRVTLTLQQQGSQVSGAMTGADGSVFQLQGALQEGGATGSISAGGGTGYFATGFVDGLLKLVVAEVDPATGQPDLSNGWELDFRPADAGAAPAPGAGLPSPFGPQPGTPRPGAGPQGMPPQQQDSPVLREWRQHISGKRLTYMESYDSGGGSGGYSQTWEADICSDGTFFYRRESSVSVNVPGATGYSGGNNVTRGTWQLVEQGGQVALQYQMEGSAPEQGLLEHQNGTTYLGGQRVFVTADNASCR